MTEIDKAIIGIYKLRTPEAFELLDRSSLGKIAVSYWY